MLKKILIGDLGTDDAFPSALLRLERARGQPLDVTAAGNGHDRVLVVDHIFVAHRGERVRNHLRAPFVAIFFLKSLNLIFNNF